MDSLKTYNVKNGILHEGENSIICPFKSSAPGSDKLGRLIFYNQHCQANCPHFINAGNTAILNCGAQPLNIKLEESKPDSDSIIKKL